MHVPVNELKKKKESLMATFRLHHKKKIQSIKSGMGEDELYNPIWPFYEPLYNFLKEVYECHSLINTEEDKNASQTIDNKQTSTNTDLNASLPETSSQSEVVPGTSSSFKINKLKVPVNKRRAKDPPELAEASREMTNAFSTLNKALTNKTAAQEDKCDLYCKLLAKKLKIFSENEQEEIMSEVDNIIWNRRRYKQNAQNNLYSYTRQGSSPSSDRTYSYIRSPHSRT
ncbi:uncharacterized protein [Diabrotica undecimpunctata]|uniref:uncharacterized protein n=1 Tax=Diabrotica undecimpunctata TaxID=50387 RepID=UPI003B6400FF